MKGTESTWNQAGSKLPMIVLASSAAGKDNLKSLVSSWLEDLHPEFPRATEHTAQGNWTVSEVIKKLKRNHGQLQFLQSELDKFINKRKPLYFEEADCIQLLDGSWLPQLWQGHATGGRVLEATCLGISLLDPIRLHDRIGSFRQLC